MGKDGHLIIKNFAYFIGSEAVSYLWLSLEI